MGGRKLQAPKGMDTRPTPDRVREALFSMLLPHLPGARVLDLYAGSGALGIEALSRGAAHVTFVEQARAALTALQANLLALGLADASAVIPAPVARALGGRLGRVQFDIILMDPPYALDLVPQTLRSVIEGALLAPGGRVVAEHAGKSPSPAAPPPLQCIDLRRYGDVAVSVYSGAHVVLSPQGEAAL
jgi:16S rRNA (guanine966-N2)-methyltransferase